MGDNYQNSISKIEKEICRNITIATLLYINIIQVKSILYLIDKNIIKQCKMISKLI